MGYNDLKLILRRVSTRIVMTRKEEIKLLATIELTNTNPFKNNLLQSAIIASSLLLTAITAFSIGSDHGLNQHNNEMLIAQGITPPPRYS